MSKVFYRKQFSNYLGEQRAIDDIIARFEPDGGITPTPTPVPVTPTPTPSITPTRTLTPTPTPSVTSTLTPTPTKTGTPTPTPTRTPAPACDITYTELPSPTPSPTPTVTPTNTSSPTPTMTPTPSSSPLPPFTIGNRLALDAASYPGSGNWNDISGNGNVISLLNSPTYSSSNGGYFTFNGINQYGTAPNSASLSITGTNFTCEYWVKANTIGDYIVVAKAPYTGGPTHQNGNYMLWYSDNYELFFTTANVGVTDTNARVATFTMNTNWHQVVYQYSAGTGTFYMDGALMTTIGANDGYNLFPTTNPLQIGRRTDNFGYLDGNLSIINISDYALTPAQITQNWNYYRTRYGI